MIVLLRDEEIIDTRPIGRRQYFHAAQALSEIDISLVYLGFGVRDESADGWLFSQGIYVPNP